jgi:DNA-binding GntR family transcriptional regulator
MGKVAEVQVDTDDRVVSESGYPIGVAAIVSALEEDIVFGRAHPRERLIEEELLTRFATKRHVVRQAFVELERMGLVDRIPNRGAMVRAYTADQVRQLYFVRDLLETQAARLIPLPLPAEDLDELRAAQRTHDSAVLAVDLREVFRANISFHRLLFSKSGNAYLSDTINEFAQRAHLIRFYSFAEPEYIERARQEHWKILSAIEASDREGLVELCARHIIASKEAYLRAYRARGA